MDRQTCTAHFGEYFFTLTVSDVGGHISVRRDGAASTQEYRVAKLDGESNPAAEGRPPRLDELMTLAKLYADNIKFLVAYTRIGLLEELARELKGEANPTRKSIFWALHLVAHARREHRV